MSATSIDLSQIKTDALSAASTFRTLIGLGTSDTPTFKAATLSAGTLNGTVLDIAQTWGGTGTYTGIRYNVTDSGPANAASSLMDLQVGGSSRFSVGKAGNITLALTPTSLTSGMLVIQNDVTGNLRPGIYSTGNGISLATYGNGAPNTNNASIVTNFIYSAEGLIVGRNTTGGSFGISNGIGFAESSTGTVDTFIGREAANTFIQRNGTSAQTYRIYNTTDAGLNNYERAKIAWESNVLRIGTEKLGTGSARALELQTDGTTRLTIGTDGKVRVGAVPVVQNHFTVTASNTTGGLMILQNTSSTGYASFDTFDSSNAQVMGFGYGNASAGVSNLQSRAYLYSNAKDIVFSKDIGTTISLAINGTTGNVGIGTASPSYKTQISGTYNTVALGLTGTHAADDIGLFISPSAITGSYTAISANPSATTGVNYSFGNSNASSSSAHSRLDIYTTSANGGDPKTTYTISGVRNWCVGVDNSDSDKFKISASDSPGSGDYLTIDTSGNVNVNSGSITSYNAVSTTTPSYLDLLSWSTNSWWRLSANYNSGTNEFAIANQNTGWIPFFAKGSDSTIRLTGAIEHSQTTTAQSYKIYNTTDGINYERGKIAWESNVLKIGTEKAGTGAARALELQTDGTTRLTVTAAGKVELGTISASANAPLRIQVDGAGRAFVLSYSSTEYTEFVSGGVVKGLLGTGTVPMALSNAGDIYFERASVEVLRVNSSGLTVSQNLTLSTKNLVTDTTTGTKIGTGTTQKLGFYNSTPVVQPAAVADATDAASVITQLNLLLARMRDLGLIAT